jgi:Chaperone of endosialidase
MSPRRIISRMLLTVGLVFGWSPAQSWSQDADPAAKVALTASAIHVMVGTVNNFTSMQVRIQAPNGDLVLNARSTGEAVSWAPSATTEDGYYRYEADVFSQDPAAATAAASEKEEEAGVTRQQVSGPFVVKEGLIVVPVEEEATPDKSQSRLEMEPWWQTVLTGISDFLVPSAHAQLLSTSTAPTVNFDDTQDEVCSPAFDWQIATNGGTTGIDLNNTFVINGVTETAVDPCAPGGGNSIPIIILNNNGTNAATTSSINTLVAAANGDLGLANNSLFIDRSTGNVGIGTTTPATDFQVIGSNVDLGTVTGGDQNLDLMNGVPDFGLVDTTDSSEFSLEYNANVLVFQGPGIAGGDQENDIISVHGFAPANSLTIASTGRIGVGTLTPLTEFHLNDASGASTFRLQNPLSTWDLNPGSTGLFVINNPLTTNTTPVKFFNGAPTNSLVVTGAGDVGIGTAAPAGRFQVVDNVDDGSFLWALNNSNTLNAVAVLRAEAAGGNVLNFQAHAPVRTIARFGQALGGWAELLAVGSQGLAIGSAINVPIIIGTNNLERIRVTSTGVTVFGTFTNSSSRELKEDIRPLTTSEALEGLAGLEPMKFRYKEQTEENLGFIAEDVPDVVAVEGRKSIGPMDVIALVTKVVKEQQTQLKTQEQTITEMRQVIAAQQQMLTMFQTRLTAVEQQRPEQPQLVKLGE